MNCTTFVPASKLLSAEGAPSPATPAVNETETDPRSGRGATQSSSSAAPSTTSRSPSPSAPPTPRRNSAAAVAHPPTPVGHGRPTFADDAASPLALEAALQRLSLRQGGREPHAAALREPPRLQRRPHLSLPPPLRGDADVRAELRPRALTLPREAGAQPAWFSEAGSRVFAPEPSRQHASSALGLFFGPRVPWPEGVRELRRAAPTAGVRPRSPEAEAPERGRNPKRHCSRR